MSEQIPTIKDLQALYLINKKLEERVKVLEAAIAERSDDRKLGVDLKDVKQKLNDLTWCANKLRSIPDTHLLNPKLFLRALTVYGYNMIVGVGVSVVTVIVLSNIANMRVDGTGIFLTLSINFVVWLILWWIAKRIDF
jgi:hypothetical protein